MKFMMHLQLFAHAHQDRWSSLVDKKLRQTLVTRDNYIFNTNYEGDPKAGRVKIPVRDTEVAVKDYDKATGVDLDKGSPQSLLCGERRSKGVSVVFDIGGNEGKRTFRRRGW